MTTTPRPRFNARTVGELIILLAIPAILVAIHYLTPLSFQQRLVLDQTAPELHAFWTNALIHEHRPSGGHLLGNISAYLLLIIPCWLLYHYREQKRWFWAAFVLILAFAPLAASISSYVAFTEILGVDVLNDRGFSGVVAAFDGFLIMSILQTFAREQEEPVAMLSVGIYFGYLLTGLGAVTGRLPLLAIGILSIFVTFVATRTRFVARPGKLSDWGAEHLSLSIVLAVAALMSTAAFGVALPADLTTGGDSLTNIVAHGAGILFGMAVEIGLRHVNPRPRRPLGTTT